MRMTGEMVTILACGGRGLEFHRPQVGGAAQRTAVGQVDGRRSGHCGARIDFDRAAHAGGIAGAQESPVPLPASSDTIAVDRTGPDSGRLRFTSGAEMLKL